MAVPTLSTVQNTLGVQAVRPADPEWMKRQALAIMDDLPIDAIKIGALPNAPVIQALIDLLNHPKLRSIPLITDTVLGASQGMKFLDEQGIQLLVAEIFPRSRLVTPNWPEWQTLLPHISGIKSSQTAFWADIENEPKNRSTT